MRIKPCLLVVILVALAIAPVFADGMFVQSPLYPGDVSYTYSSQLGISGSSTSETPIILSRRETVSLLLTQTARTLSRLNFRLTATAVL